MKNLLLTTILLVSPTFAFAQQQGENCFPTGQVMESLRDRHGESRQITMMVSSGKLLSVMGNSKTGTWTLMEVDVSGTTCLLAEGPNFVNYNEPPVPQGEDG